jgi:hypothetical protein
MVRAARVITARIETTNPMQDIFSHPKHRPLREQRGDVSCRMFEGTQTRSV